MTPLRIRARLRAGLVQRDPWSPAIDGILAAVVMTERLGHDAYVLSAATPGEMRPVEGLPLAVQRHGDLWWYLASCPAPIGEAGRQRRHIHRRFDDQHERHLIGGVGKVLTAAGPYKATRLAETVVICRGLEWHAVGDAAEVRRLLAEVTQIGARRAAGAGEVVEWIVTEDGDAEAARLRRPLPADYAAAHGVQGMAMPWAIVPPARIGRVECVMPGAAPHAA